MEVACGQCLGCRLDHSKMWAARMAHEAAMHENNCFITLTYDEEHLPRDGSLNKKHFQDFMKRLRQKFSDRTIRYYHCGEYGDQLNRPHYHACLFNLEFPDEQLFNHNDGYPLFISQTLQKLWPYGFSTIGDLTMESAAYTARYCLKKVTGVRGHDHYLRYDQYGVAYWLQPEYATMSRGRKKGQGIGADWFHTYTTDVFPSDTLPIPGVGLIRTIPRYYEQLYGETEPDRLQEIKKLRQQFHAAHADDYTPQRLMAKYKVQMAKCKQLQRGIENET